MAFHDVARLVLLLNVCQSLGWNSLIEREIRRFSDRSEVMIA
jgi:hypothetical protein